MEKSSSGKYFFKSHLMNLGVLLQFQVFLQSPSALAIRGTTAGECKVICRFGR